MPPEASLHREWPASARSLSLVPLSAEQTSLHHHNISKNSSGSVRLYRLLSGPRRHVQHGDWGTPALQRARNAQRVQVACLLHAKGAQNAWSRTSKPPSPAASVVREGADSEEDALSSAYCCCSAVRMCDVDRSKSSWRT